MYPPTSLAPSSSNARRAAPAVRLARLSKAGSLAVAVGAALGSRLPQRAITLVSALAFAVFGALLIAGGVGLI